MSIKHPKERRMDAFDWFIGDGIIVVRCRVPASRIVQFYSKSWQESIYQRKWIQEGNSEFYPSTFPSEFRFFAFNAPMICIRHN